MLQAIEIWTLLGLTAFSFALLGGTFSAKTQKTFTGKTKRKSVPLPFKPKTA